MKNRCPYKNSKPTKKAVTNARSSFANPKANRSDDRGAIHVTSMVILLESVLNEKFLAIWTNQ
jgi:hypothetical protein